MKPILIHANSAEGGRVLVDPLDVPPGRFRAIHAADLTAGSAAATAARMIVSTHESPAPVGLPRPERLSITRPGEPPDRELRHFLRRQGQVPRSRIELGTFASAHYPTESQPSTCSLVPTTKKIKKGANVDALPTIARSVLQIKNRYGFQSIARISAR